MENGSFISAREQITPSMSTHLEFLFIQTHEQLSLVCLVIHCLTINIRYPFIGFGDTIC